MQIQLTSITVFNRFSYTKFNSTATSIKVKMVCFMHSNSCNSLKWFRLSCQCCCCRVQPLWAAAVGQPCNSIIICRVQLGQSTSQFCQHRNRQCKTFVCGYPQAHRSELACRHLFWQALQWPCAVRKWFMREHCHRGRSKPGCRIVGSTTTWELTTKAQFQWNDHMHHLICAYRTKNNWSSVTDHPRLRTCDTGIWRVRNWFIIIIIRDNITEGNGNQTWSSPFTPSTVSICPAADSSVPSSPVHSNSWLPKLGT